jgi:hypothetical protein
MAFLAAKPLHFGHSHSMDANGGKCLADFLKLEGFDDGSDEFHGRAFSADGILFGQHARALVPVPALLARRAGRKPL